MKNIADYFRRELTPEQVFDAFMDVFEVFVFDQIELVILYTEYLKIYKKNHEMNIYLIKAVGLNE